MSKEGKFLVYCLEIYRKEKKMTGKQVIDLFRKYGVIDYIMSCYEALHTTGWQYTVEDIDIFVETRQTK
jgi:ubiquinone/menaquinone biosynthesis C-methylase UbiE